MISPKLNVGLVDLHGPKAEVVNAKLKLVSLLQGVLTNKVAAATHVHWQYFERNTWKPFTIYISTIIEDSFNKQDDHVSEMSRNLGT